MVLFRFVMEILKGSEFFTNKMNLRACESRNLIPFFHICFLKPSKLLSRPKSWNWVPIRCNQNDGEILCLRALKAPLAKRSAVGAGDDNNNNELYLHDHTSTYSIAKAMFRNQNYNTGQLRYFDNNLSRTSKQAEIYFMNCILIK